MERDEKMKELNDIMKKIYEAMKMSEEKQVIIDSKEDKLRNETRIMMIEEGKEEIKRLKQDKTQFDRMTEKAAINIEKEIMKMRKEMEKEYQEILVQTLEKKKTIQRKLKSMKNRDLTEEKLKWAEQSAHKAMEKVDKEVKDFLDKQFEQRLKLDNYEKLLVSRKVRTKD